jgi:hypothetical protein
MGMHARDALSIARMDGTALKTWFALMSSGREGMSSEQIAEAIDYGTRYVQIALRELIEAGHARAIKAGRSVRYIAATLINVSDAAAENIGRHEHGAAPKGTPINVMLSDRPAAANVASHGKDSKDTGKSENDQPKPMELAQLRQTPQTATKKPNGAAGCADAAARPIAGGMNHNTRTPMRTDTGKAHADAPITSHERTPLRRSTGTAQPVAPIGESAQPVAPFAVSPPAPPSSKTERHFQQQHPTEIGKPPRVVVVVGDFAADLESPGYLPALRLAIGSKRNPMRESEFADAVSTYGLAYCNAQYETLLKTYERMDLVTGRLWLAAIRNDYVGSNKKRTARMLEIGKKLDARTQQQQTAIRAAVAENDAANEQQANAEREELRATLGSMTEDQLAELLDVVGSLPHHRPRNAVAQAKRSGGRPIDVLTRPTVAPFTRDVLAERSEAKTRHAGQSAA